MFRWSCPEPLRVVKTRACGRLLPAAILCSRSLPIRPGVTSKVLWERLVLRGTRLPLDPLALPIKLVWERDRLRIEVDVLPREAENLAESASCLGGGLEEQAVGVVYRVEQLS